MNVRVTGGAGYVGSVVVEALVRERFSAVVVDDLSEGHRQAVSEEATLIEGDDPSGDLFHQ